MGADLGRSGRWRILQHMKVQTVLLPGDLKPSHLQDRTVVVFDVLRATTTMTAALAAGVREIRVFSSVAQARAASDAPRDAEALRGKYLLCGEVECVAPEGFALGNSPGAFNTSHAGAIMFMATTNGTAAIVAARSATVVLIGSMINAQAVARRAADIGRDITLLCAGTREDIAEEDLIGAGAVASYLPDAVDRDKATQEAVNRFNVVRGDLVATFRATAGGKNIIKAGLADDIPFAAKLNALETVGQVLDNPLRVVACDNK